MIPQYYKLESISNPPKKDGYYIFLYEDHSGCTCSYDVKSGEGSDGTEMYKISKEFKYWLAPLAEPVEGMRWRTDDPTIGDNYYCKIFDEYNGEQKVIVEWADKTNGDHRYFDWCLRDLKQVYNVREDTRVLAWLDEGKSI